MPEFVDTLTRRHLYLLQTGGRPADSVPARARGRADLAFMDLRARSTRATCWWVTAAARRHAAGHHGRGGRRRHADHAPRGAAQAVGCLCAGRHHRAAGQRARWRGADRGALPPASCCRATAGDGVDLAAAQGRPAALADYAETAARRAGPRGGMTVTAVPAPFLRHLTDVQGIEVGQFTRPAPPTGCSVVLARPAPAPWAAWTCGRRARHARDRTCFDPANLVGGVHAVLLAGGSAWGLDAAAGVMRWLEEHGIGLPVGGAPADRPSCRPPCCSTCTWRRAHPPRRGGRPRRLPGRRPHAARTGQRRRRRRRHGGQAVRQHARHEGGIGSAKGQRRRA